MVEKVEKPYFSVFLIEMAVFSFFWNPVYGFERKTVTYLQKYYDDLSNYIIN